MKVSVTRAAWRPVAYVLFAIPMVLLSIDMMMVHKYFPEPDTTEVAGRQVHSFVLRLHETLRERAEVDFQTFMEAVAEVDRSEGRPRYKEGREFPTLERFELVVRLLGLEDPELPEILTSAHMTGIFECVIVPPHHQAILDRLGRGVQWKGYRLRGAPGLRVRRRQRRHCI